MKVFFLSLLILLAPAGLRAQDKQPLREIPCETNRFFRYEVLSPKIALSKERVFVIARLGDGESSPVINRIRLNRVKLEFGLLGEDDRIVFAQGEKVKGLGGVEVYLGSELVFFFKARRGAYLAIECCECNWRTPILKKGKLNRPEECP